MPIVRAADAVLHEMHGARFTSYAAPARGSTELCAWRLDLPGGATGMPHTVSREEILFVLSGSLQVTFEPGKGPKAAEAGRGDVIVVPAGSTTSVATPGGEPAAAWVTTSAGLTATLPDGATIPPPWVR